MDRHGDTDRQTQRHGQTDTYLTEALLALDRASTQHFPGDLQGCVLLLAHLQAQGSNIHFLQLQGHGQSLCGRVVSRQGRQLGSEHQEGLWGRPRHSLPLPTPYAPPPPSAPTHRSP